MTEGRSGGQPHVTNLVSVITPCYNAVKFLTESIESVAVQTYPHIEHIVVDDGSTDGSWEVIERYVPRVTALRLEQNRGGSHARNRGAVLARGSMLMFLDADDLIAPETVEALALAAGEQPGSIAICQCKRWVQQPAGGWSEAPRERPVPETGSDLFEAFLAMSAWPPPCCVLWRRETYDLTGGWDEELARDQDTDILLRAYARGARVVRARRGVGYYRSTGREEVSVSSGISSTRYESSIRVLDKLAAELERLGREHAYTELLSLAYHRRALFGFRAGFWEAARESLRKGEALGRQVVSTRRIARVLEHLLGLERKERVVQCLAGLGITTASRRETARRKRMSGRDDQPLIQT